MEKEEIQLIGAGWPSQFSGSSNRQPSLFRWVKEDRPIKVFVDASIIHGIKYKKTNKNEKKIGWFAESRAIIETFTSKETIEENMNLILENYDSVYTADKTLIKKYPKLKFNHNASNMPWINNTIFEFPPIKPKLVSMVSSTKNWTSSHKLRCQFAEKYKDKLDLFGGVAGSKRIGEKGDPWPDKSEAIIPYMFSVAIENDKYPTYFTEKLTDCFVSGTIPIYWGSPDIGDYFNLEGMIIIDDITKDFDFSIITSDLYHKKLAAIEDNYHRAKKLEISDDILYKKIKGKIK